MYLDESRARIGHRGGALSRAKELAVKGLLILGAAVTLVSAFVVSLVFVVAGFAVVVAAGTYLWWQTRHLRKQLHARMREQSDARPRGVVLEGEVIPPDSKRR